MISILLAAAIALASPAPAAPDDGSAGGLTEIARVRSSLSCSVLGRRIAPAVQGLLKTDDAIGAGHRALLKMGADTASGSAARLEADRWYLNQVVSAAAHDARVVQALLGDAGAAELAARLQAVATEQQAALNLLAGALETDLMGQMQSEHDVGMAGAVGPEGRGRPSAVMPSRYINAAGISDRSPVPLFEPGNLSGTTLNHTVYDSAARDLEAQQSRIETVERGAARAVIEAVPACAAPGSGEAPAPVPAEPAAPRK